MGYYLKEAERQRAEDDLDGMVASLEQALAFQPNNQQVAGLLKDAQAKNTAPAWFAKAEQAAKQQQWVQVAEYLRKAQALQPDQPLQTKMAELKQQGAQRMLQQGTVLLSKKKLYTAYQMLQAGMLFSPTLMNEGEGVELRRQLAAEMSARSQEQEAAGWLGNAWYWQDLSMRIVGGDREGQQRLQSLKDRMRQRVVKKIAIMDFAPPTNSTDSGRLVTDSLLS